MKFITGAISELIKNLLPNNNKYYLTRDWVTDELIPLLKTMNQRAAEQRGIIQNHQEIHSNTIIVCVVLGAAVLMISIYIYVCYKNQAGMSNRLQNAVHNLLNNVGLRAPNPKPDFRV